MYVITNKTKSTYKSKEFDESDEEDIKRFNKYIQDKLSKSIPVLVVNELESAESFGVEIDSIY